MSLTRKQTYLYFTLWKQAWAVLQKNQQSAISHQPSARHQITARALGVDKSSKDFTNADFDKVLGELRAIIEPDNLAAQLRQLNQERGRLLYGIRREANLAVGAGKAEAWLRGLVRRMNQEGDLGASDLDQLGPDELRKVRIALTQQERREAVAEGLSRKLSSLERLLPPNEKLSASAGRKSASPAGEI